MKESLINSQVQSQFLNTSEGLRDSMYSKDDQRKNSTICNTIYFTPESQFIIIWQFINLILIYIYFIQIPITIAFENHRSEQEAEFVFEIINIPAIIIFIATILIKLKTSYYQSGILISEQSKVIRNYLKFEFILDFLSITSICIYQFSEILSQHEQPISYRFIVLLFFLKAYDVFIIETNLINSFDLKRRTKGILKLLRLLLKVFLICNISACGFFYLSDQVCNHNIGEVCWIDDYKIGHKYVLRQQYWSIQYAVSLYWASTTMISIGYGDITPQNTRQIVYTIFMQFGAALIFAYCLNAIWSIAQQLNSKKNKINYRMNTMNIYLRDKKVNSDLRSRINAYLSHYYHTKNLREKQLEKQIIEELTPSLRKQLHYETYGFVFRNHKFFSAYNQNLLFESSVKVFESGFFEGQLLISPLVQYPKCSLHYVYKGNFIEYIPTGMNEITLGSFTAGDVVGLYCFITQLNNRSVIKTQKYSLVYSLLYRDWKELLKKYTEDFQKFQQVQYRILLEKDLSQLNLDCKFCNEQYPNHISQRCLDESIKRKYMKIVKKFKVNCVRVAAFRKNTFKSNPRSKKLRKSSVQFNDTSDIHQQSRIINHLNHTHSQLLKNSHRLPLSPKIKPIKRVNKQKHLQKIEAIIKQSKNDNEQESFYTEESQIINVNIQIDKVTNYQYYFKRFNSDSQGNRQRRNRLYGSMRI